MTAIFTIINILEKTCNTRERTIGITFNWVPQEKKIFKITWRFNTWNKVKTAKCSYFNLICALNSNKSSINLLISSYLSLQFTRKKTEGILCTWSGYVLAKIPFRRTLFKLTAQTSKNLSCAMNNNHVITPEIARNTMLYLTICSIFFLYLRSIFCRYSGLISIAA